MSSAFLSRFTNLHVATQQLLTIQDGSKGLTEYQERLLSLIQSLKPPCSEQQLKDALDTLRTSESNVDGATMTTFDGLNSPDHALVKAVVARVAFGIYANALDLYLSEASSAENDAEWWTDINRSWTSVTLYLLETLPGRLLSAAQKFRAENIPLRPATFYPSSFRRFFPSRSTLLPHPLTVALFPHLDIPNDSLSSENAIFTSSSRPPHPDHLSDILRYAYNMLVYCAQEITSFLTLPLRWTRQECELKRKELEKIRDERAEVLGRLVELRPRLTGVLGVKYGSDSLASSPTGANPLAEFIDAVAIATCSGTSTFSAMSNTQSVITKLDLMRDEIFVSHKRSHFEILSSRDLLRPSRLTLLWPRIVLLPPLSLYLIRSVYASRASLLELAEQTVETAYGFFKDWLLEPIKDVVKTIRAGGEDGVIVQKEAVAADMASLERMTLALAQDALKYNSEQLKELSRQIRQGDLTAVLRIYEEDIKSPVKSAVSGTLLRSAFVQIQKAKVDIDQALAGIDKLLKSQELTFAFVGVAPAFAVVYALGGFFKNLWLGGRGRGVYGGKHKRAGVWLAMRRIERILVFQPKSSHRFRPEQVEGNNHDIPPLTSGLLILSVTHLRKYAEGSLPARSRLREGFLEDVQDLEDPALGKGDKMRVIDRMWKSWGEELGWNRLGAR